MYNKQLVIGYVNRAHGLKGALNVELYYKYSLELLEKNPIIIINEKEFKIERIFGIVELKIKLKLVGIDIIEDTDFVCAQNIIVNSLGEKFYQAEIIGFDVRKNNKSLGYVEDVYDFNAGHIFETDNKQMMSFNEIDEIFPEKELVLLKNDE